MTSEQDLVAFLKKLNEDLVKLRDRVQNIEMKEVKNILGDKVKFENNADKSQKQCDAVKSYHEYSTFLTYVEKMIRSLTLFEFEQDTKNSLDEELETFLRKLSKDLVNVRDRLYNEEIAESQKILQNKVEFVDYSDRNTKFDNAQKTFRTYSKFVKRIDNLLYGLWRFGYFLYKKQKR